jgi:luciferase family oxidoreductase group 1
VNATPGAGTNVPLYILGSSLFGAELAAHLGLPYGFASHFAPDALAEAVALYRRAFRPSDQLDAPYVLAGVNVVAAQTDSEAQDQLLAVQRARVAAILGGGRSIPDEHADLILQSPQGRRVREMMTYAAVGTPDAVKEYLDRFGAHADADELIVVHAATSVEARLRSVDLLADVSCLVPTASSR